MKKIIVGVDGSASSLHAVRWAAEEGKHRGVPLEALLAWGSFDQHHYPVDVHFDVEYGEADARQALGSYLRDALGPDATDHVGLRPVCDAPARALLAAADDAALIVVGSRGRGGFQGLLLGSVSQKVLHHATCPVAVVREEDDHEHPGVQRIVVGIDGSAGSDAALRWALEEGRCRGADVEVVHAWNLPFMAPYPYVDPAYDHTTAEDLARSTLDKAIRRAGPTSDDRVTSIACLGGAPSALLEAAKGADLLVVGSRGWSGVKSAVLGSTSQQVVLHASCPVVVVPGRPRDADVSEKSP